MEPVTPIPCCEGIYGSDPQCPTSSLALGIYDSVERGESSQTSDTAASSDLSLIPGSKTPKSSLVGNPKGILLFRPLLSYTKEQLIATLQDHQLPYISDPTNSDPTFTRRNACRKLLTYKLPQALTRPSILSLASKAVSEVMVLNQDVERALQLTRITMDVRSGCLIVTFPPVHETALTRPISDEDKIAGGGRLFSVHPNSRTDSDESALFVDSRALSLWIHRLVNTVNPLPPFDRPQLGMVRNPIFGSHLAFGDLNPTISAHRRESFSFKSGRTVVSYLPDSFIQRRASLFKKKQNRPNILEHETMYNRHWSDASHGNIWKITRRIPTETESAVLTYFRPRLNRYSNLCTSEWMLWDGRFWIRLVNASEHDIKTFAVRFLTEYDLFEIREQIRAHGPKGQAGREGNRAIDDFGDLLASIAPEKIRFTLPVIVGRDNKVRFLPTLPFRVPRNDGEPKKQQTNYEIEYREIDPVIYERLGLEQGRSVSDALKKSDSPWNFEPFSLEGKRKSEFQADTRRVEALLHNIRKCRSRP